MDPQTLPLRDIRLPEPVSWWPPAPGWWVLAGLLLLAAAALGWWWRQHRSQRPLRRAALAELAAIEAAFGEAGEDARLVEALSALLRRTAMSYLGREACAGVHGRQWARTLARLADERFDFDNGPGAALVAGAYAPRRDVDRARLIGFCREYLQALPARGRQ